jgi:hypothetical protein
VHHQVANNETADAQVGITGAQIEQAAGVGVFAGKAQVGRARAELFQRAAVGIIIGFIYDFDLIWTIASNA